ncbi:VanZ family protein [Halomonas saccharevitans]|uniref:VanZ like family protein n=1 Tax=Halomonas saccharevitans TaxID=416872 RepID=A0A1I6YPK1_9GAMM|nr:VanZ family protein [Halomonas saccharevitans]SFT52446.1 VanZ like family protein [Halomonas saccharevitans]
MTPGVPKGETTWRRLWAALAVLAALVIAWGSLTSGSELPESLPWDKASHFIAYAGLAGLIGLAGVHLPRAFLASTLLGVAIEFAQIPVPGRFGGDWHDILANTLGAACAVTGLKGIRLLQGRRVAQG